MYVLLKDDMVIESSYSPIVAAADGDYFVSLTRHHYDPRPSSGAVVIEMEFPEESFCEYKMVNGVAVLFSLSTPLVDRQAAAWERIKAERDRRKAAGVQIGANWFHTDVDSRVQQLGLKDQARDVLAAGGTTATVLQKLGQNINWQTLGGGSAPMTVALSFAVVAAVGDLDAMCHHVAGQHRMAMTASSTPETYDISVGWPPRFEDAV